MLFLKPYPILHIICQCAVVDDVEATAFAVMDEVRLIFIPIIITDYFVRVNIYFYKL
jgi:hypothetical protein